jgi:GxxExxY protein
MKNVTKSQLKELIYQVNGAAIEVHKWLGAGLLESVYHECLIVELKSRGVIFEVEKSVPIVFKEYKIDTKLRCDLLVENSLVVELKAVEEIHPIFQAQLLTYMKLLKVPMGLLINFNCQNLYKEGQRTYVNEFFRNLK